MKHTNIQTYIHRQLETVIIEFLILCIMTTLHSLVTISELFASFNPINTGVVNCLIMCQNARKMHHSEAKKSKNFLERGHSLPKPHPLGASSLRRSTLAPKRKSWIRQCVWSPKIPYIILCRRLLQTYIHVHNTYIIIFICSIRQQNSLKQYKSWTNRAHKKLVLRPIVAHKSRQYGAMQ